MKTFSSPNCRELKLNYDCTLSGNCCYPGMGYAWNTTISDSHRKHLNQSKSLTLNR